MLNCIYRYIVYIYFFSIDTIYLLLDVLLLNVDIYEFLISNIFAPDCTSPYILQENFHLKCFTRRIEKNLLNIEEQTLKRHN